MSKKFWYEISYAITGDENGFDAFVIKSAKYQSDREASYFMANHIKILNIDSQSDIYIRAAKVCCKTFNH